MQKRIADYGVRIGELPKGARNKISDVPGVTVGHFTADTGDSRTGVTVILPGEENPFLRKPVAAAFVWNGFGKTAGLVQVQELGTLETPVALTNTLNVGLVQDALVEYTLRRCAADGVDVKSVNPVVGECNDASLNRISRRVIGQKEVFAAIGSACADFAEGDVGAGKGTVCYSLKGGIGSASRVVRIGGAEYTLGVLVQSNYGRLSDLTIAGRPIGRAIAAARKALREEPRDRGSIMMVVATDLPLSARQLGRVIRRASVGLARLGSYVGHGSGEIMIGFTTANRVPHAGKPATLPLTVLNENQMDPPFRAAGEACEEAVLNSMVCARAVTGYDGTVCPSLADYLGRLL